MACCAASSVETDTVPRTTMKNLSPASPLCVDVLPRLEEARHEAAGQLPAAHLRSDVAEQRDRLQAFAAAPRHGARRR